MINLDDVIRGVKQLAKADVASIAAQLEAIVPQLNRLDEIEATVVSAKAQAALAKVNDEVAAGEKKAADLRAAVSDLKSKLSPLLA